MTSEERQSQTPKSIRKISSSIRMKTPLPPSRQGSSSVHRHGATIPTTLTPQTRTTMTTPNNTMTISMTAHTQLSHTKQTIASYRKSAASSKVLQQSKTPKRLYLIRHGQSMGQIATKLGMDRKRDSRLLDAGLSALGVQQAQQLAQLWNINHATRITVKESPSVNKDYNNNSNQHLYHDDAADDDNDEQQYHDTNQYPFLEKYASPDLVVSSPLTRAIHTALLGFPGRTIVLCSELAEIGSYSPENTLRSIIEIRNDLMGKSHLPMEITTTTTTTTIVDPIRWNVDHSRLSITSRNNTNTTTNIATTCQSPYYESKRNRIQAIRRFLRYLYTERSEECIAVVCHYNVIRCILEDDTSSTMLTTTMTNNTIRPQNATPILCDLYANGRVVPCEKRFVSSCDFGEERKRLNFENII